jgi:hypothetical protein
MLIDVPIVDLTGGATGRFYTYVYRDVRLGREGIAVYVGKGTENPKYGKCGRAIFHWARRSSSRGLHEILKAIHAAGLEPIIEIVGWFEHEPDAFTHEAELIARYGRRDLGLGLLCNLSDGGEGPIGHRHTADTKEKIAAASRRMHSDCDLAARRASKISASLSRPETRARRSAIMREVHSRPGDKERRVTSQKAAFSTLEYKARQSTASRASQQRPEVKIKHSAGLRARHAAPGAKDAVSAAAKRFHSNPVNKEAHRAAMREFRARPDVKARYAEFYARRREEAST